MVSRARPRHPGDRARHAPLLPRELRDARPPRRALRPPPAAAAARDHRGRSNTAPRARTSGRRDLTAAATSAKVEPLLRGARAVRRLDLRHPPRPVAEPRRPRRRCSGRSATRSGSCTRSPTGTRTRLGLHHDQRDSLQPAPRRGFRSIGCIPCTRPTTPEEEERASPLGGLRHSSNAASIWRHLQGEHMTDHIYAADHPGDDARPARRLHALVHRARPVRKTTIAHLRRARARPPRPRRRVPRRRHRAHPPLEGPRLLEGGPRHAHRARSAGSPRG